MELVDMEKEVMDLRERTGRMESSIETLIQQQTAVETLAQSVQEIALSLRELTVQTHTNTKQLEQIDCESKKKRYYLWCVVAGGILGAVITYVMSAIL